METLNPYESPQSEVPARGATWSEKLANLSQQSRVSWGATLCFWALVAYLCFNIGSSLMLRLVSFDSGYDFYYPLRRYGTHVSTLLHIVGLLLLCFIGEQTRAKTYFKLSLGCFLAYQGWQWIQYFETLEEREATPIPRSVEFLAQLTWILAPLLLFLGLRRVSAYCRDRQMGRWSFVAIVLYTLMALLQIGTIMMNFIRPDLVENLGIQIGRDLLLVYELIAYLLLLLGIFVAYCYGRLLRRIAKLWDQPAAAEVNTVNLNELSGATHEPESV